MTRGSFPRQIVDLLYGTPVGSSGEQEVVSRSTGTPAVFFAVPRASTRSPAPTPKPRRRSRCSDSTTKVARRSASWRSRRWIRPSTASGDDGTRRSASPPPTPHSASPRLLPPTDDDHHHGHAGDHDHRAPAAASRSRASSSPQAEPILAGTGPGDPGTGDLTARASAALEQGVPGDWRGAVPVTRVGHLGFDVAVVAPTAASRSAPPTRPVTGPAWRRSWPTSSATTSRSATAPRPSSVRHPPAGRSRADPPVERWADCVSQAFTGYPLGSHGQSPCEGASQSWTTDWLAVGPAAHPRTG